MSYPAAVRLNINRGMLQAPSRSAPFRIGSEIKSSLNRHSSSPGRQDQLTIVSPNRILNHSVSDALPTCATSPKTITSTLLAQILGHISAKLL
ncbi:hypothetical protein ACKLNR_008469 [Fusarium oxysporum f. sp. zingiberi]